jgi:hypothetical protein
MIRCVLNDPIRPANRESFRNALSEEDKAVSQTGWSRSDCDRNQITDPNYQREFNGC